MVAYVQKNALNALRIVILLFAATILCAISFLWWESRTSQSNLNIKKKLNQINVTCEKLYSKSDLNKTSSNTVLDKLDYLCSEIEQTPYSINRSVKFRLLINDYIYVLSVIFLLPLLYLTYRKSCSDLMLYKTRPGYMDNQLNTDPVHKNEKNRVAINTCTDVQQYTYSLDVAHKSLLQLVEEPESNEPFTLFLNEIEKLTHAKSSAIFMTPKPACQFTLLKCTDKKDQDWTKLVPLSILPKIFSFESREKKIAIFEEAEQSKHTFICIRLHDGSQDCSLLVIKLVPFHEITDATTMTLLEHANRLANIVSSVRLARLKLRRAQYEERAVIARELHDSLAQSLSYLKIQTSRLQNILTDSDIQAYSKSMEIDSMMQDLRSNLNIAYRHLRELISTFRLTIGGKNFSQALTDSVEEFSKRSGIAFDIDKRLPEDSLTVTEETQLLHIIRESLSNVVRHSQAKFSLISIYYDVSGQIVTIIEDDGIGLLDISDPEQHFGIIIMQERAHSIGGNISLTERPNGGTCLKIVFQASKYIEITSNS